jgi:integrase
MTATNTLRDVASDYMIEHSLTDGSAVTFIYALVSFEKYLGRPATIDDLTTATIAAWIAAASKTLATSTALYYRRRVVTLWYWAAHTGLVSDRPSSLVDGKKPLNHRPPKEYPNTARQWLHKPALAPISTTSSPTDAPPTPTPEMRLADYYRIFYSRMKLNGRSIETKRLYHNTLRKFDKFLGRPATLADLNDSTVTAHIGWIAETGRSPRTGNKSRDQLLAIWRYAARKRHLELWPDVEPLREYTRTPTAWTIQQLAKIIDVARLFGPGGMKRLRQPSLCGIPADVWWVTLFLVLYDTGIRIGAAMQLRCDDYQAEQRRLFVRAETQKHRADQVLPVSEETAEALAKCIAAAEREQLFPWPHNKSLIYFHFNRLLKAAGLPAGRRDKFHKIRRTSATAAELALGPGAASIHLGHSSPKVTERYLDRSMLPTANVAAALPRPVLTKEDNP